MNYKPKLSLKKLLTPLLVITLVMAISLTASAMSFIGNSNSSTTYKFGSGFTYGFLTDYGQFVSWRISLYVSTSDDGTIDPESSSIVSKNGLGYIGTILYDNFTPNLWSDVYIQSNYTADTRNATLYNAAGNTVKQLPYVTKVKKTDDFLWGSSSQDYSMSVATGMGAITPDDNYIYHTTNTPPGLPILGSQCNGKVVEQAISNDEFTEYIIEDMNDCLGGSPTDFNPIYAKVASAGACKAGTEAGNKLKAAYISQGNDAYTLLLPTNPDCIVEWCLVVEPLGE